MRFYLYICMFVYFFFFSFHLFPLRSLACFLKLSRLFRYFKDRIKFKINYKFPRRAVT